MFFQPPDPDSHPTKIQRNNPRRKRTNKSYNKKKKGVQRELYKRKHFSATMSSWAESFAAAATWQLKHQVAYWKSKAVALEYENKILHEIIKKNYIKGCSNTVSTDIVESDESSVNSDCESEKEENDNLEVSEEFIEFLRTNAKYKEDAKREREKLKAKLAEEDIVEIEETEDTNSSDRLKELYGKDWERIAALEMSIKCTFMNVCDKEKPMYWPNIPFNFS